MDAGYATTGTVLTVCPDRSVCCTNENTECCDAGRGKQIDDNGQILLGNGQVSAIPSAVTMLQAVVTSFPGGVSTAYVAATQTSSASNIGGQPTLSTSPASTGSGSSTPVGAIVGGVVGGIAVILLIALVLFLIRRNKKKRRDANIQQSPSMTQPSYATYQDSETTPMSLSAYEQTARQTTQPYATSGQPVTNGRAELENTEHQQRYELP